MAKKIKKQKARHYILCYHVYLRFTSFWIFFWFVKAFLPLSVFFPLVFKLLWHVILAFNNKPYRWHLWSRRILPPQSSRYERVAFTFMLRDQFANYGWLDLWSNLPSKLSFNIGLTEFQNTLLPNAQEYVDVFFRYTYHLSNQLIVKQVGVEPTEFNWEHLTDYLPLKSCTLNQAKYYLLFHCFLKNLPRLCGHLSFSVAPTINFLSKL